MIKNPPYTVPPHPCTHTLPTPACPMPQMLPAGGAAQGSITTRTASDLTGAPPTAAGSEVESLLKQAELEMSKASDRLAQVEALRADRALGAPAAQPALAAPATPAAAAATTTTTAAATTTTTAAVLQSAAATARPASPPARAASPPARTATAVTTQAASPSPAPAATAAPVFAASPAPASPAPAAPTAALAVSAAAVPAVATPAAVPVVAEVAAANPFADFAASGEWLEIQVHVGLPCVEHMLLRKQLIPTVLACTSVVRRIPRILPTHHHPTSNPPTPQPPPW